MKNKKLIIIKCILILIIAVMCILCMTMLFAANKENGDKSIANTTTNDVSYNISLADIIKNGRKDSNVTEEEATSVNCDEEYGLSNNDEDIETIYNDDTIGTLKIPKLSLEAQIKEGIDLSTLANYIGHFTNSSVWEGNVALAAHNRGSSVEHYFEGIHLLEEGDEIIYNTNMGERRYKVYSKKEIDNTDWSITLDTNENTLTMVTCITGHPEKRLCVQARAI